MKKQYIDAIIYYFGFNKKQANKYYNDNKNNVSLLNAILSNYIGDAKKAFYND